jgi:hypothetical protein
MKTVAYTLIVVLLVCASAFGAEPYPYRLMDKQDTSYGGTKRMVYRVYLNTQTLPDHERMKATAKQAWQDGNRKWNEFIVLMIFGQLKDFNAGAYGIAKFTPSGMIDFRVNDVPLQMLEAEQAQSPATSGTTTTTKPAADTVWLDPQKLRIGQAFFVSKEAPLMPELEPADPLAAVQRVQQIPKGGAFKVYEVKKKGASAWYRVVAFNPNKKQLGSGWINSTALLGQDLKPYK